MKKWALLGMALLVAASGIGWSTIDPSNEKVVATAGANIRVIEATRNGVAGYELEISWSGRRAEDIAVLHVSRTAFFSKPLGVFRPDDAYHATSIVWQAGTSGTTRIFWRPPDRTQQLDNDLCSAVLIFAPDKISINHIEKSMAKALGGTVESFMRKAGELDRSPQLVGRTVESAVAECPELPWLVTSDIPNTTRHVYIGTACPCCEFHNEPEKASDREGLRIEWKMRRSP